MAKTQLGADKMREKNSIYNEIYDTQILFSNCENFGQLVFLRESCFNIQNYVNHQNILLV